MKIMIAAIPLHMGVLRRAGGALPSRAESLTAAWADEIDRQLEERCHPSQRDFVYDPSRLITACVGRGGGKTTGQMFRFVRRMARQHRAKCVFICLTRPLAEEILWQPLKDLVDDLGIDATFNETKLTCTFKRTGSTLRLVGADDKKEVNKLRGQPFDEVCIDEAAAMSAKLLDELIDQVIGPRLGDRKGTLIMISTPGRLLAGPFYDATRPGACIESIDAEGKPITVPLHRPWKERHKPEFIGWNGWSSHAWSLADPEVQAFDQVFRNLWEEAQLKKALKRWSDTNPIWCREYLGIWQSDDTDNIFRYRPHLTGEAARAAGVAEGAPWNEWDPKRTLFATIAELGTIELAELPAGPDGRPIADWLFVIAMDLGMRDPFACNVFAFSPSDPTRTIYHVYGFERTEMYSQRIAVLLMGPKITQNLDAAHNRPGGVVGAVGGEERVGSKVADAQHGKSTLAELARVYGVHVKPADQADKLAGIELVNEALVDGRLKILKGSKLAEQLGQLQWVKDEHGFPRENKSQANHSTDTLVYGRREVEVLFDAIGEPELRAMAAQAKLQGLGGPPRIPNPEPEPEDGGVDYNALYRPSTYDSLFKKGGGRLT